MSESPRIGLVGFDAPRQLILAAGATPVQLLGASTGAMSARAQELLGAADAPTVRLLDRILELDPDDLAGLVVCNSSATLLNLFYALRMLSLDGEITTPLFLLDMPPGASRPVHEFKVTQLTKLAHFVESITGQRITRSTLEEARDAETRLAATLQHHRDQRGAGEVSGSYYADLVRAATTLPPTEALTVITQPPVTPAPRGVRVFVTGSPQHDTFFYKKIEDAGFHVVGDDSPLGDLASVGTAGPHTDVKVSIVDLARAHSARPAASNRSLAAESARTYADLVNATRADIGVSLTFLRDDAPLWDLADQREATKIPLVTELGIEPGEEEAAAMRVVENLKAGTTDRG